MSFELGTALVVTTLIAAVVLLVNRTDRMFPTLAVIAAGIQALMVFGIMSLTLSKFRIDVILPALLVVAGGVCWGKSSTKPTITAATLVTVIGALELLLALRLLT